MLAIIIVLVTLSLLGGILSWFDYRQEEVTLLDEAVAPGFREMPKLSNFWRWYETYVIVLIIIAVLFVVGYVEHQIIPLIR